MIFLADVTVLPEEFKELDDPYLELFDRINQQDLEIVELRALVMALRALCDAATMVSRQGAFTEQQRAYDQWVARGMLVGGQGAGTKQADQVKFKFFD